jgi:hypothetical protein
MNTMLATTDTMTLTRMAVIGKRTNSALMAGAKAMMVENVKNQMRTGVAHFVYMKKSGELREAFGTTSKALVERYVNGNGISRECYATTAYFDVEKAAWRSFRWENIVAVL